MLLCVRLTSRSHLSWNASLRIQSSRQHKTKEDAQWHFSVVAAATEQTLSLTQGILHQIEKLNADDGIENLAPILRHYTNH